YGSCQNARVHRFALAARSAWSAAVTPATSHPYRTAADGRLMMCHAPRSKLYIRIAGRPQYASYAGSVQEVTSWSGPAVGRIRLHSDDPRGYSRSNPLPMVEML